MKILTTQCWRSPVLNSDPKGMTVTHIRSDAVAQHVGISLRHADIEYTIYEVRIRVYYVMTRSKRTNGVFNNAAVFLISLFFVCRTLRTLVTAAAVATYDSRNGQLPSGSKSCDLSGFFPIW